MDVLLTQRMPARAAAGVLDAAGGGRELSGRAVRAGREEGSAEDLGPNGKLPNPTIAGRPEGVTASMQQQDLAAEDAPSQTEVEGYMSERQKILAARKPVIQTGDGAARQQREASPVRPPAVGVASFASPAAGENPGFPDEAASAPPPYDMFIPADAVPALMKAKWDYSTMAPFANRAPAQMPGGVQVRATEGVGAARPVPQPVGDVDEPLVPAYKSLLHWEGCLELNGQPLRAGLLGAVRAIGGEVIPSLTVNGGRFNTDVLASLLLKARDLEGVVNRLTSGDHELINGFGEIRTETLGPEREPVLLIEGTPICIKFGCSETEVAKYKTGIAYRKLLEHHEARRLVSGHENAGELDDIKSSFDGIADKTIPFMEKQFLLERYDADTIVRTLKAYFDNGPADEVNAWDVGEYEDVAGSANRFVILKNPRYDNNGREIGGNAVDLQAGGSIAHWIDIQANDDQDGLPWGVRVSLQYDGMVRKAGGKHLQVVPTLPGPDAAMEDGPGDAADTYAIMKENLSRLSRDQLQYLRDDIGARKKLFEASGDAFLDSGYRIVFPSRASDMPTLTHVNFACWMPAKPPAGLSEAETKAYTEIQQEVQADNVKVLDEMLGLVNDTLQSQAG
ncbi:hypothetical protein FHS82_000578 [Pseudochelatococcus lubricantis]|uniref:Uncharacterized protein n=1 Tax=Pseudochelatococcus lubricantis TaxID=1538102 RepID=A0ABX0UXY8_9HYPH|nr:hypothetical protein [Pseudochelatococcus lubricantis]NIJ56765.1 hypothetical protein [Pseudochelatococcus lubricantis]